LYFPAVFKWAAVHWWRWNKKLLVGGVATGAVGLAIGSRVHTTLIARWPHFPVGGTPEAEVWTYLLYVLVPAVSMGIVVFLCLLVVAPSQIEYERQDQLARLEAKAKESAREQEVVSYLRAQADQSEEKGDRIATRSGFYLWRRQWKDEICARIRRWLGQEHSQGFENADHLRTRPSEDEALYVQGECLRNATYLRRLAQQVESGAIPILMRDPTPNGIRLTPRADAGK
jgi:hypothetical protein